MDRTIPLKKLVGLDPTPTGIGSQQRTVHECTVCGAEFSTSTTTCPNCGGQTLRSKTTTLRATFNLLFVITLAGFAIVYNIFTGTYPKEGPAA